MKPRRLGWGDKLILTLAAVLGLAVAGVLALWFYDDP